MRQACELLEKIRPNLQFAPQSPSQTRAGKVSFTAVSVCHLA